MIQIEYRQNSKGFTLVELMLSMAIIGALLLVIATTGMFVMKTYTRGTTIREVNQVGRTITEDMQRTISMASPFTLSSKYVTAPGGGRLCTGNYTYAWNYGNTKELKGDLSVPYSVYNIYTTPSAGHIRFVKVLDPGGNLCYNTTANIDPANARELIVSGDATLAVQSLVVSEGARHDASGQAMYLVSVVIGTNQIGQLNSANSECLPSTTNSNFDFCSINRFDIIVRASSRSGSV